MSWDTVSPACILGQGVKEKMMMPLCGEGCEGASWDCESKNCPRGGGAGGSLGGQVGIGQADGREQQSQYAKPWEVWEQAGLCWGWPALLSSLEAGAGLRPLALIYDLHVVIRNIVLCQVRANGGPCAGEYPARVCLCVC